MIRSFAGPGTEDVFRGRNTRLARRACPADLWKGARRKLDPLNQAESLIDLRAPPANGLEKLAGNRSGQHSLRINDRYRVCFAWTNRSPTAVEIVDYH